jgi:hypothetical protein
MEDSITLRPAKTSFRALMCYQKRDECTDSLAAHGMAGIKLIYITRGELSKVKARGLHTIDQLLVQAL